MKRFAALAVVVLGVLASVTAAQASTTIGTTGPPPANLYEAANGGIEIITPGYVVPAGGGTIVSLNTQSSQGCILSTPSGDIALTNGQYDLQVLRPSPVVPGDYTVLGHTGPQHDPCNGQLISYPVNIPVQAGDVLGVYVIDDWKGLLVDNPAGNPVVYSHPPTDPAVNSTINVPLSWSATMNESATLVQGPQSINDCKNGGWKNFTDTNGNAFKNQGDCVSFVATHGKNLGSG